MEVSTIIVKQKDLGCGATKVHIIEQELETSDAQTRLFWKTLGGKADVAGNVIHSSFLFVLLVIFICQCILLSFILWSGAGDSVYNYGLHSEGKFTSRAKLYVRSTG